MTTSRNSVLAPHGCCVSAGGNCSSERRTYYATPRTSRSVKNWANTDAQKMGESRRRKPKRAVIASKKLLLFVEAEFRSRAAGEEFMKAVSAPCIRRSGAVALCRDRNAEIWRQRSTG